MWPALSVLVCTHNPQERLLRRTLEALARQTLPRDRWELLLIDNKSASPIRDSYDLSWHINGKHVLAEKLGKTHAIARGVGEAKGVILVIVDDDNLLHEDYLELAVQFFHDYLFVGAAGGAITGEYESTPPAWAVPYLRFLAIMSHGEKIAYAFTPDTILACPGAGMVIRKSVVERYLQTIAGDLTRQGLDPVGDKLSRSGDVDMMLCAYDIGLAKGYFPALRLTHVIPTPRLTLEYLARLYEESEYCDILLRLIRGLPTSSAKLPFLLACVEIVRESIRNGTLFWQRFFLEWVALRGRQRAFRDIHASRTPNRA